MAILVELSILGINAAIFITAVFVGLQISIWLGIFIFVATSCIAFYLFYNYDYWLVRWLTKRNPRLLMSLCETGAVGRIRRLVGAIPANPRCRFCQVPFGGLGALLHIKPSAKNPNFCRSCFEGIPVGSENMVVGILFADIRGFTSWTESHSPVEAAEKLTHFYTLADRILTSDDAFVEFVGDQVMVLYLTIMPTLGDHTSKVMLAAAKRLVAAIRDDVDSLPIGVGLNLGACEVGNFVKGQSKDFTAVGDAVNTTARLQSAAQQYQIVLSESVYAAAAEDAADARATMLSLKGKSEPVSAHVVDLSS